MGRYRLLFSCLALLLLPLAAGRAGAHPHIWVAVEATVVYKQGVIVALRQKWTFDPLYAAMAVDGLDTNKDGKLSREELKELAKVNVEALKEFGYFTVIRLAGTVQSYEDPTDYWLEYGPGVGPNAGLARPAEPKETPGVFTRMWRWMTARDEAADAPLQVLSLVFELPLKQPILAEAPGISFSIRDPGFYISFDPARSNPIRLGEGAPVGCRAEVGQMEFSSDDAKRLAQAVAGAGEAGLRMLNGFGTTAAIICDKKS